MARMIPPEMGVGSHNRPEEIVFRIIRDSTPEGWIALHHVGVPRHPKKPLGEIDFLLISEVGVFGLEVKGGAVGRTNGVWKAGKRVLKESPFQQVGSATAALRNEVSELHPWVFGYGCVFPECQYEKRVGQEGVDELVFDASGEDEDFTAFVKRLGDYWSAKYPHQKKLGAQDIRQVADILRPDFQMVESIMPSVRQARKGLIAYTDEQLRAVNALRETNQVVVKGGAGTGKTLIAANEALRLAEEGRQTLFTCFSKRLAAHLEERTQHPNLHVAHLDELISQLIKAGATDYMIEPDASDEDKFGLFRPLAAIQAAETMNKTGSYDAIVVDEAQDLLTEPRMDVLECLLSGGIRDGIWRFFWDPQQALFTKNADLSLVLKGGTNPVSYPLNLNCRNTRFIADWVEYLSDINVEAVAFVDGPEPVDANWNSEKTQIRSIRTCIKDWIDAGVPVESIVILSPRRFEKSIASRDLKIGVTVRDETKAPAEPDPKSITFCTIHSFKGLESDAVVLVDLEDVESSKARSLMYVGASRARVLLGVVRSDETTPLVAKRIAGKSVRETESTVETQTVI
jgi:hypothetical protein